MRLHITAALLAGMLPCGMFAAVKKDIPDDLPTIVLFDMPAVADEALPEAPDATPVSLTWAPEPAKLDQPRLQVGRPEFAPVVNALYSMPLVATAMRMGGGKFNTNDGSSINAFAICYRLNGRSSVQVIPGDPAPVKLPVATMANNMGVTVGMVYRLTRP